MPPANARFLKRGGRFTAPDNTGSNPVDLRIIRAGTGAYRIFNSGDTAFTILPEGSSTADARKITLSSKSAADVKLTGDDVYIRQASGVAAIEGIYEVVDAQASIRGGRFKGSAGTDLVILQGREGEPYRILNSGKQELTVKLNGTAFATVRPRHSLDVAGIDGQVSVSSAVRVQGMYEYLTKQIETRSGRFRIKQGSGVDPTAAYTIINLTNVTGNAWYRIFNAGEHLIKIVEGTTETDLLVDQSLDFRVGNTNRVIAVKSTAADRPIQGIYDFLR